MLCCRCCWYPRYAVLCLLCIVSVLCSVVHNELAVYKVKAVGFRFKRRSNHILALGLGERRKLVNVFNCVFRARDAETKVKVKRLEQTVLVEMSLHHLQVGDRCIADLEGDAATTRAASEAGGIPQIYGTSIEKKKGKKKRKQT